ncbi:ADP-ribosylglycohydrolase family protein [Variovorax rhizosphaerae]|uniref:ADP-ribosylglycohydrolase family protein n=1 Tax=Variovorax rhizosphaerae TaxID=1836200 RepID=A0ABU8X0Y2_9BURK
MKTSETTTLDRHLGALFGLACGDAVGTTVEFSPRGSFKPVTDMSGGGPFHLRPGQWTDDTSMALCLAASLVHCRGFDAQDQMNRYCNWRNVGYMSSTGTCFDIGGTVNAALNRYLVSGDPFAGNTDPRTAGNGALMRLAPVVMFHADDAETTRHFAGESTRTTHAAPEAIQCSQLFGLQLLAALQGKAREDVLATACPGLSEPKVMAIACGDYRARSRAQIKGSGYCVQSLEAALWCFAQTDSFEAAVLMATNLGDDADTTAAICGQIAGAFYGVSSIPAHWLAQLALRDEIEALATRLYEHSQGS